MANYAISLSLIGWTLIIMLCAIMALLLLSDLLPFITAINSNATIIYNNIGYWGGVLIDEIGYMIKAANDAYSNNYRSPYVVHHIVAQLDSRASSARVVLTSNSISVNAHPNLVSLRESLHLRLHTNLYHMYVTYCLLPYEQTGSWDAAKYTYAYNFLLHTGYLLSAASGLCP